MEKFISSKKIAYRTDIRHLNIYESFFRQVLRAAPILEEDDLRAMRLIDDSVLELYTPNSGFPEYLFTKSGTVLSYPVNDLQKAFALSGKLGIKSLSGIVKVCNTFAYCHLQMPDNTVIGLYQESLKF